MPRSVIEEARILSEKPNRYVGVTAPRALILSCGESAIAIMTPRITERTHPKKQPSLPRHLRPQFFFPGMTRDERDAAFRLYHRTLRRGNNLLKRGRLPEGSLVPNGKGCLS